MSDDRHIFARVTRVEVIDSRGRAFVENAYSPAGVMVCLQDDGRTLKVFAGDPHAADQIGEQS